jgi:hypothetical protein
MKAGLLIQGPLISSGRTGRSLGPGQDQSLIVDFDCTENLQRAHTLGLTHFDAVVIVLWEEDAWWIEGSGIPRRDFLVLKEPNWEEFQEIKGSFKNKYRQYFACLNGLMRLSEFNCQVFSKIRSDQSVDLHTLAGVTRSIEEKYELLFPNIQSLDSAFLEDFYFSGKTNFALKLFNSLMYEKEISRNTHADIFLHILRLSPPVRLMKISRHLFPKYCDLIALPLLLKVPSRVKTTVFIEFVYSRIGLLDHTIWEGMKWRGEIVQQSLNIKPVTSINLPGSVIGIKIRTILGRITIFWMFGYGYQLLYRTGQIKICVKLREFQLARKLNERKE